MTVSSPSSPSSYKKPSKRTTSFARRQLTLLKKAEELSTLCGIEVCVVCYSADGALETWPKEIEKVKDIALKYKGLNETERHKRSLNLSGFLEKTKPDNEKNGCDFETQFADCDTRLDGYSTEQLSELQGFLERKLQSLQQRQRLSSRVCEGEKPQSQFSDFGEENPQFSGSVVETQNAATPLAYDVDMSPENLLQRSEIMFPNEQFSGYDPLGRCPYTGVAYDRDLFCDPLQWIDFASTSSNHPGLYYGDPKPRPLTCLKND